MSGDTLQRPATRLVRSLRRSWSRLTRRPERGAVAFESVLTFPLVILLLFTIIQAGIALHAYNCARTASEVGVQAARVDGGSVADGIDKANSFMAEAAGFMSDATASGGFTGDTVTISVTASVPSLVPFMQWPAFTATSQAPIEEVTQ